MPKGGKIMAYRRPTKKATDKKIYKRTAQVIKKINVKPKLARGGIRL